MFKVDDELHVEFDGVIQYQSHIQGIGQAFIVKSHASNYVHALYYVATDDFKRAAPAMWPPKLGDVWVADDIHYFTREQAGYMKMCGPVQGDAYSPDEFLKRFPQAVMLVRQKSK